MSLILLIEISKYFLSYSIPIYFRSLTDAATPVVPLPLKGSNIMSPLFVDAKTILSSKVKGF